MEFDVLKKAATTDASIKFQRKILLAVTSAMEWGNRRWDPFNLELDGWSEQVADQIGDFDDVFERLGEKYSGSGSMPPEAQLMLALSGSAFSFHLSKQFLAKSRITPPAPAPAPAPAPDPVCAPAPSVPPRAAPPAPVAVPPTMSHLLQELSNPVPPHPRPQTARAESPPRRVDPRELTDDSDDSLSDISATSTRSSVAPVKMIEVADAPVRRGVATRSRGGRAGTARGRGRTAPGRAVVL